MPSGILVVRLGAMGDIIHALPAVASLKESFPELPLTWIVESNWAPLLEGNPSIDRLIPFERRNWRAWAGTRRDLRRYKYAVAVDFQGLLKSAAIARIAGPARIVGFHRSETRERLAGWLYSTTVKSRSQHVVDRNLDLAAAAGATKISRSFYVPPGKAQGNLPSGGFILASPFAGWRGKQWPLEYYSDAAVRLRKEFGLPLVLNGPASVGQELSRIPNALIHVSGLPGLIDATRRATAIIGVDSGPMHLAAALEKPGVALFGPTDPERNGPCSASIKVVRGPAVAASTARGAYARSATIDRAMRGIMPEQVIAALKVQVMCQK
ncbi:MAG: glycosyltransferase family 9 protein [Acidobacteriota bacterium]|nr:glycosyltransferase family 9 protein [Acidobacteriota bacterium]